jgi:hypothetical protein
MTKVFFLFLDGFGLGADDPEVNPVSRAQMPTMASLLDGRSLVSSAAPYRSGTATLVSIDPRMGVAGRPQSATGQAALISGRNVPREIGSHYGPKPNAPIREILDEDNLFREVTSAGCRAALLNAYPRAYFDAIHSGRRLHSSIVYAASSAGVPLRTVQQLRDQRALSADFTGAGWASRPDFSAAPVHTPRAAGKILGRLALEYDFSLFDYWLMDYAGHRGDMDDAVKLLETFDSVLAGLLEVMGGGPHLILLTSDHGNIEDIQRRGHTLNPVPALLIAPSTVRDRFAGGLRDLTSFAGPILETIFGAEEHA